MTFRVSKTRPYAEQRSELLAIIWPSGSCYHCKQPTSNDQMEFDHLGLKSYVPSRINSLQRLRVYYREWMAAGGVVGQGIVGACHVCNSKGGERANTTYRGKHKRRRNRRGAGYSTASYIAQYTKYERERQERESSMTELEEAPF